MSKPPATVQDIEGRWARPLEISGGSSAGDDGLGFRPTADDLELLDPARGVLLGAHGGIVDILVEIGLLPIQYQKYQPQHFVSDGHDGFLMRFAHHQTAVFGRQGALGHACGVGAFAQDEANVVR